MRNGTLLNECVESKHESGLLFEEPDIDCIDSTKVFPGFQVEAYKAAFAADFIYKNTYKRKIEGEPGPRTHIVLDRHCGFLYPRTKSQYAPLYQRSSGAYMEEWTYYKGTVVTIRARSVLHAGFAWSLRGMTKAVASQGAITNFPPAHFRARTTGWTPRRRTEGRYASLSWSRNTWSK